METPLQLPSDASAHPLSVGALANTASDHQSEPDTMSNEENPNATKTLITLATYNEIENLPLLVEAIFEMVPDADLLVIDDNSPDGTGQWCDDYAEKDDRLRCIHREGKLGLGTATIAAMRYSVGQGYRYMLNLDADFSHPPRYLPQIIAAMADASGAPKSDVVIGSRYVPGGGIEGWPFHRHLMSRAVNTYARCLLGLPPKDCSGAYRCYRVELLAKLDFDAIRSRGYSFQEEILLHVRRLGARFAEVPIVFVDRVRGQSKINLREAFYALWIIFRLGLSRLIDR